jgi:hypothetical protein
MLESWEAFVPTFTNVKMSVWSVDTFEQDLQLAEERGRVSRVV